MTKVAKSAPKSLLELHELAARKIEADHEENRKKSVAKIKELTTAHNKKKLSKEEIKERMAEDLSSDSEKEDAGKTKGKADKPSFPNKNSVSNSKAENKRAQK